MIDRKPQVTASYSAQRVFFGWLTAIIVVFCATYLLRVATEYGSGLALIMVVPLPLAIWILFARGMWWAALPVATSMGGLLYFGFKIYTHELALALGILALLPYLALVSSQKEDRPPLSISLYLLLVYLTAHLCMSEYFCRQEGMGGMGNILRVYMYGLWGVVFAILFFRHGSTRYLKHVLFLMYIASIGRIALGLLAYWYPGVMFYIPFINYVPSGTYTSGMDLRASALLLAALALCYSSMARSRLNSLLHLAALVPAGYMLLLGGGRVSLALFCGTVFVWALIQRKFLFMGTVALTLALLVGVLNADPSVIRDADPRVQRTLSILILKGDTVDVHKGVEGSDTWHYDLMKRGQQKWLASPMSFLFGNRVHRYDEVFWRPWVSHAMHVELASQTGYYEAGLWTVLAVTGMVGAMLYVFVFYFMLRDVFPVLLAERISDHANAFSFLAVSSTLMWLLLSWIYGHFPSQELMLAVIAKAALHEKRKAETQRTVEPAVVSTAAAGAQ